jgi:hypothetical protein
MIGTITNRNVALEVGSAFGGAAGAIRNRLEGAVKREAEGRAATREDTFTDDLVDAMAGQISVRLAQSSERLSTPPGNVKIEFEATKAPQGEENDFGLDLGVRVIIESPGYSTQKAILVQCKRMYGRGSSGTFPKLRGDGEEQAKKMLEVTPASFFFLFNGGREDDLLEMMGSAAMWPWDEPYRWFPPSMIHPEYFDPGVAVLPATRVLAMSQAAKTSNTKLPTGARDVLAGSVPLGHFIAGLFAPCFVGDVRTPILQLATPPGRRAEVSGLDAEVPGLGQLKAQRFHKLKIVKSGQP